jgi:biofilm PGA synthesis N-glycosyltransferase PgaC
METLFWTSVLVVVYVYAGYPLLLAAWSAAAGRPVRKRAVTDARGWPSVSVVVAAHNEGMRLPARVSNLLQQLYPRPLEIIVVSDGSTDSTSRALAPFTSQIKVIELPRSGKPGALNAGVAASTGEIVVFADARQLFAQDTVLQLVSNFADPDVGGATGELILDCEMDGEASASTISDGVGLYWAYEKWLRRQESRVRSTLGATGAVYALRRELWHPLPADTLLDDVLAPMRAVLAGRRIVFDERARAYDRASADGSAESRRKTRTLAGNYQILWLEPRLLVPFRNPVWVQYFSHKVGRLLVPWALVAILLASAALARDRWLYAVALILQLGFYGLAALGAWIDSRERSGTTRADELRPRAPDLSSAPPERIPRISSGTRVKAG